MLFFFVFLFVSFPLLSLSYFLFYSWFLLFSFICFYFNLVLFISFLFSFFIPPSSSDSFFYTFYFFLFIFFLLPFLLPSFSFHFSFILHSFSFQFIYTFSPSSFFFFFFLRFCFLFSLCLFFPPRSNHPCFLIFIYLLVIVPLINCFSLKIFFIIHSLPSLLIYFSICFFFMYLFLFLPRIFFFFFSLGWSGRFVRFYGHFGFFFLVFLFDCLFLCYVASLVVSLDAHLHNINFFNSSDCPSLVFLWQTYIYNDIKSCPLSSVTETVFFFFL